RIAPRDGGVGAELLAFEHVPYDAERRSRMLVAMEGVPPREYCRLSVDFAEWLSDAACAVMRSARLSDRDVMAIASHGQTIWHEPGHSTWQIGEPAVIAERTGVAVIANFRARDM